MSKHLIKIFDMFGFIISILAFIICLVEIYKHYIYGEYFWGYIIALIISCVGSRMFLTALVLKDDKE